MEMALRLHIFSVLDPIVLSVVSEAVQLFGPDSNIDEKIRSISPTDCSICSLNVNSRHERVLHPAYRKRFRLGTSTGSGYVCDRASLAAGVHSATPRTNQPSRCIAY